MSESAQQASYEEKLRALRTDIDEGIRSLDDERDIAFDIEQFLREKTAQQ